MPKPRFLIALALAALLPVAAMAADKFTRIASEAGFRQAAVGKYLWSGNNHIFLRENGRIAGQWDGIKLKGAWEWREGYLCRSLIIPATNTDCQLWMVNGRHTQFYVTRDQGRGGSFTYTVR
ncbi:hypothetical protein [Actibacterium sp. XHP0104]|uniref:hypothetical protein n=1 Tax=Actibacterium sp. XHP0104 TaxID=2984335 RepID=UPI0021E8686D|nr:hypothetical protein [Actibacterium sp. XHP0104]MCV2880595.1 hypothetical protein [Actibacterium sp. XHP0104]